MRCVERWITYDGNEHFDLDAAIFYLEEKRGNMLCKLAHELVSGDFKYTQVLTLLDKRLDELAEDLVKINKDRKTQED